jgi:hypothetical protein
MVLERDVLDEPLWDHSIDASRINIRPEAVPNLQRKETARTCPPTLNCQT